MQDLDSNLRLKTSAIDQAYGYLFMHSAGFRFKPQLAFDGFRSILNHYARHCSCCFAVCIYGYSWKLH